jgi:hypothetical protein
VNEIWGKRAKLDASLDNRTTYTHTEYLAGAYERTKDLRFHAAVFRGLDYMLRAQDPSGGWPHSYPDRQSYHPHITFLDDVTIGTLTTLSKAAKGKEPFGFLDATWRARCQQAVELGNGTLRPTRGRSYELPSLVSGESVAVVRYLMSIDQPSPEVRAAVEGAVAWFRRSAIHGLRIKAVQLKAKRGSRKPPGVDRVAVEDPTAPPIWARYYEIETNRPFMANRTGKKVYRLAQVQHERRAYYSWYGSAPSQLLTKDYPRWKKNWGAGESAAAPAEPR